MEHYDVIITRDALEDLLNLKDYLELNFGKEIAKGKIKKLQKDLLSLGTTPYIGINLHSVDQHFEKKYFLLRLKHNVIFYGTYPNENKLRVLHLYGTKQDYIKRILRYFTK